MLNQPTPLILLVLKGFGHIPSPVGNTAGLVRSVYVSRDWFSFGRSGMADRAMAILAILHAAQPVGMTGKCLPMVA